ncbi:uncharacterized protein LOC125202471 isoform X2 [Salvia hispanica]|uniref:uncharacterized protein LOC125202471 isoform X2 n=1 Tax=Salvia hispanica TaxID=49212 RepID=UPI002009CF69|nr:uncharacterized protein LOC125202471 isoform X2 [Salvia hispanica]
MVNERQRKMKEAETVVIMIEDIVRTQQQDLVTILNMVRTIITSSNIGNDELAAITYSMSSKLPAQVRHMDRLFGLTDRDCISNLRMDRNAFGRLCRILRDRSGHTVSHYVHKVMRAVIHLHSILFVQPTPVDDTCEDPRWKWFKGCLGALDGTYINVRVSIADTPRYRSRKGQIATNTLAVCDRFLRFVYILPGWEGSVADSRVLRDAVTRPNGLKVRRGTYYLCDNGYANSEGFLTPFKGVRYHLKEWGPQNQRPTSPRELFNMRHTMARNIIERAFAVLKMRGEMQADPVEQELDDAALEGDGGQRADGDDQNDVEYVDTVESTPGWNQMRQDLADYMWQNQ